MNIIKCSCSRSIHVYAVDKGKCPFCDNTIEIINADNYLPGALSSLNEKLSQIDKYISEQDKESALRLIDEVLELMPGWKIGEIPKSGEIYWRKLLAETGCRNDIELFESGKLLQTYTAFNNAMEYANDDERPVYALIKKTEDLILERLREELDISEYYEKYKIINGNLLIEYKRKINELKKLIQENICRIEEKEKEIREQVVDYDVVAGEYKYALSNFLSEAQNVGNNHKSEITKEEKDDWRTQLDCILTKSNAELDALKQLTRTHPRYLMYSSLINEQSSIRNEIDQNMKDLNKLQSETEQLTSTIENITNKYAGAREEMRNESYASAKLLLQKERFDEIVNQAISEAKVE